MNIFAALNKNVLAICKEHYPKKCDSCPIRPQCIVPMARSIEEHNSQTVELNRVADLVRQESGY